MSAGNGCASSLWNRAAQTTADPPTGCSLVGSDLRFLIGFYRLIDRLHPLEELRHRRQQLLLEQGDLFLPIGVIHPGPGDQQAPGGVARSISTAR